MNIKKNNKNIKLAIFFVIVCFFVTYKKERPWGCKKFGFISKFLPAREVFSTTGIECAYRTEKISN
mgnify:CR=1 FL=1